MGRAGLGPSTNAWCDGASFCAAALSLPALFVAPGRGFDGLIAHQ